MDYKIFEEELRDLIRPLLENEGFTLVELNFFRAQDKAVVKILADRRSGGISIDECARLNQQIGDLLDSRDTIKDKYLLEVSSPGLDRPLRTREDFGRCIGKEARFFLKEQFDSKLEYSGKILDVKDDSVSIDSAGRVIELPIRIISKAKQQV
ncbi:MAG: ribosome maturation factor RimP [Candidatus Omnitrophota bacterium]|jgi:ribosome maturation factor RimP|nr:MAG: ribosome maturation factor RimP [Candidatus Omnitrophota bacterium]